MRRDAQDGLFTLASAAGQQQQQQQQHRPLPHQAPPAVATHVALDASALNATYRGPASALRAESFQWAAAEWLEAPAPMVRRLPQLPPGGAATAQGLAGSNCKMTHSASAPKVLPGQAGRAKLPPRVARPQQPVSAW